MDSTENETQDDSFSNIASKFISVMKLQTEALTPPTFSTNIIDQLKKIFNQIETFSEQNKSNERYDLILFQKIAQLTPEIEELINQNYLHFQIVNFQAKLNEAHNILRESMSSSSQINDKFQNIMIQLKKAIARSYSCDFTTQTSSFFTDLQTLLEQLEAELTSLNNSNENEQNLTEKIPQTIIQNLSDIFKQSLSILKHLDSSNSLILSTNSLINSVKKILQKNLKNELPLQSHKIYACPSKPKIRNENVINSTEQIRETVDKLINEFESDPEKSSKIDEYSIKFDRCIKQEYEFFPPILIIQNILRSMTDIIITSDMENDKFSQFSELYQKLSQLMLFFYQLPKSITNSSEISLFINQIDEYESSINENKTNLNEYFAHSLHDFLLFCKYVKSASETVDKVNKALGQNLISLDLDQLHILKPSKIISFVDYKAIPESFDESDEYDEKSIEKVGNIRRINAFRSLNVISQDIVSLRERGIDIVPDPLSYEIHPLSILPQIFRTRETIHNLEQQLFQYMVTFGDPTKNDESFLSTFDGIQKEIDSFYAFVSTSPLSCIDFRIKTLLLYQQKFPVSNEESIQYLLNFYSLMFDIYSSLCKLDEIGTVPVSSSIQLSYILTMCDDLADHYPCFNNYLKFFNSIDLFNINNEQVLRYFEDLRKDLESSLSKWNFEDIENKVLEFSKEIKDSFEKLEKSIPDDLIVNLMRILVLWVDDSSDYRSKANIRELYIQMEALKNLISQKVHESQEFAESFNHEAVCSACNLFVKLRDRFEERCRLQSFLSFVECSQNFGKSYESVTFDQPEKTTPSPDSQENQSVEKQEEEETTVTKPVPEEQEKKDEPKPEQQPKPVEEKKKFNVFTNEKARQIWFDKYSTQFFEPKKTSGVVDYIVPSLVFCHFIDVVTKYCHFLSLGESFIQNVNECFAEMIQDTSNKHDISKEELQEYFSSNYEQFKLFLKKEKAEVTAQFDLVIRNLNEFGSKMKNRDSHFNDVSKNLNSIRSSFKFGNFVWVKELYKCFQNVNSILKESESATSLPFDLLSSFQRLNNMIYYIFVVRRCFKSLTSDHIQCHVDTSLHLTLLENFSESDHLIHESSSLIIQDQIHFILEGESAFSPIQLGTSMKILRLFGQIVNLPVILSTIESEFFNFEKFFARIPHNLTSLQVLINSALFSSANFAKRSLFELVATNFAFEKFENTIRALERLKIELASAPFDVEVHQINETISACSAISDLNHIALIDDSLSTFCNNPEWDPENRIFVSGKDVFSLRLRVLSVQSRLLKLSRAIPEQYDDMMRTFLHNFSTSSQIPSNFGVYDNNDNFFNEFIPTWTSFVSELKPVDLSGVYDILRHSCRVIVSSLNDTSHKDIATLKSIDQLFQTTHDPLLIYKMRLSFLYVQKQLSKYTKAFKENELPFEQVDECLQILSLHSEFSSLIQSTTNLLNESFNCPTPIHCLTSFSIDFKESEVESEVHCEVNSEIPNTNLIDKQLSFADQTSLAQAIHITAAANQKDYEKHSSLPVLVDEVNELSNQVSEEQKPIDQLAQIVAYMTELLDIISSQAPNGKEEKDSSNEAASKEKLNSTTNYNLLKKDLLISTSCYQNVKHQFDNMVKMSLKIDEENEALLNDIIVNFDKLNNLMVRAKSDHYNKMFLSLSKSQEVIQKALDTMIVLSNDQYMKGEFDSPFNKSLIGGGQNRNPINLKLIFLKDKLNEVMKEKGVNPPPQDKPSLQSFLNDFYNKSYNDQVLLLKRLRSQLKNQIDVLKNENT